MAISNTIYHTSKHLSDLDLLPLRDKNAHCLLCGSDKLKEVWVLQRDPYVSLRQCLECDAVGASRIPTPPALDSYYAEYYTSSSDGEVHTLGAPQRLAQRIANRFACAPGQVVSILDFGGGDGAVAYLLATDLVKRGASSVAVTVVDYENRTVASTSEKITIEKKNQLDDVTTNYSIVIASAVVEHYPDPKSLLNKLLNAVEAGGLFYARTPFMLPLMKLLSRFGIRLDFTYPAHLCDLVEGFWNKFFAKAAPHFKLIISRPSMVETTFAQNFPRTLIAHTLKAPWYILRKSYGLVGGWEVFAINTSHRPITPKSLILV